MKRSTSLLIGIGLVLVGLLAGILVMLFVDVSPATSEAPQVIERVELGQQSSAPVARSQADTLADLSLPAPALQTALLNNRFREVASRVTPSVVFLQVEMASRDQGERYDEMDERLPEGFFRGPRRSVGSGVIISSQGHIVTNQHVVDGAETLNVTLADKRQYEASVVGVDETTDLAVIKIAGAQELPVITLGNSSEVEVGEWVIAVGNPFRLTSTVTAGIVGALGRQVNVINNEFGIEDFIQTDAAISPGNSGGALVNLEGELVGINTAIASRSGSYEGYGFAVPVNLMERVVRDLIEYGEVRRGYLGVSIMDVDAQQATRLGLDRIGGVLVDEAQRGGPAYAAGIRDGDVVLSVEGREVNAPNELQSTVALRQPGDQLQIDVWRDGQRRSFDVQLEGRDDDLLASLRPSENERPRQPQLEQDDSPLVELESWGLGMRPLTDEDRSAFDRSSGVYLAYVSSGSVADAAGLPRDKVLTHIDDRSVRSIENVMQRLESASDVVLFRLLDERGVGSYYEVEVPE